ncbi:MAG: AAA family ATPase [Phaeodactylibacter sp.]|nr:AAA family ATPase [Phaeodactylibacter sp.]
MLKSVYVAATSQHVGKTTSTLGLVATLRQAGVNVGYCKPVGQQFLDLGNLRVDKDALLFSSVMDFQLSESLHSPVILGPGATTAYLDDPSQFNYRERILNAASELQARHEMVIYEGTGHPGVGSVVDLSNAEVAKLVNASVVIIVEGGIGNTIDRLCLALAKFQQKQVPVIGVIVNKVRPDKLEKVRHYVGMKVEQMGLKLFGVLPYDKSLSNPIMATIMEAVNGRILYNEQNLDNRVEDYVSGSLVDLEELNTFRNLLLVVSHKRLLEAITKIIQIRKVKQMEDPILSGIIITGDGRHEMPMNHYRILDDYIRRFEIPVITTPLDTLGSVVKVSRIEVKINTRTPWKSRRAIELISENVDLSDILGK